ncbi:hypothetical protein [Roseomonas marmotae]|nr:hypothetical protein [Roseomonas marmotae]
MLGILLGLGVATAARRHSAAMFLGKLHSQGCRNLGVRHAWEMVV